ncbi:putative tail fiber [uncultured Mediterranean phage uvMED]|nr:putative tail fiber [uncultured Mediterranean phage uvMED]
MTISTTIIKNSYNGTGSQDVFAYAFKIATNADMEVIIRASTGTETVKTITTHYTVSGAGDASGGNVTFTSGNIPTDTEIVVLRRKTTKTQSLDLVENDPFTADSVEGAFDKNLSIIQELQEEVDRSIKISRTNTMTSTEFTDNATTRASKILAFDTNGELSVASELGSYKGNWSASTTYGSRDIVKDTSTNNIFIANTTHTSSGSQPLTTNTDSAKWDLLVDAATATTAQTAAATSATASATSATASASSATAAATSESNANTHKTAAETAKTAAETAKTAAETAKTAAETALDTFDDRFLGAKSSDPSVDNDGAALVDGALYFDTTNDLMKVYDLSNTTWRQLALTGTNQTNVNTVAGQISPTNNISTVAGVASNVTTVAGISANVTTVAGIHGNVTTVAGIASDVSAVENISSDIQAVEDIKANVTTVAGISSNVTTVAGANSNIGAVASDLGGSNNIGTVAGAITNVNNVGGSIANVNTAATNLSGINQFAERYRVASSDPTGSLDSGDLVFNTTGNALKYYDGSSWNTVAAQDTQVKISGNDTSADVLINKLTAGNLITLTETNDGSNETITVASTAASTGKAIAMAIVFG